MDIDDQNTAAAAARRTGTTYCFWAPASCERLVKAPENYLAPNAGTKTPLR
jgi:YHS domain-containing protein